MSKKYMHVPVFTCPKCGCHDVATREWHEMTTTYYDDPGGLPGGLAPSSYGTTNETDILMFAQCDDCDYELTDDELALIEKSIAGLALSAHPTIPISPFIKGKGYVIVNPEHWSGTPVVITIGNWVWPNYKDQMQEMFALSVENDSEHLYVGMVVPITTFQDIKDRFALCGECDEVYEPETEQCSCKEE